jgi:aldose 1-epimerase
VSTHRSSIAFGTEASTAQIAAGALTATVTGGPLVSVSSLRHRDVELLSAPDALPPAYRVHGSRAGITLLHPWANRLGGDRYTYTGIEARLDEASVEIARDRNRLAIHGLAIPRSWTVVADGDASCFATATYGLLPAFPFPHRIDVRMTIGPAGTLTVLTTIRALGPQPVPIAFGWHPYFVCDRGEGCELELPERRSLATDGRGLPTGASSVHPRERFALADQSFDAGFAGLSDGATLVLDQAERRIRVVHDSGYPYAQLFAPADAPVVSMEPMTAATDALRRDPSIGVALPGQPFTAGFTVEVQALSRTGLSG